MSENDWLKDAIIEFIKNNDNRRIGFVDIVSWSKLRADIPLNALKELQKEGRVAQRETGISTYYIVTK